MTLQNHCLDQHFWLSNFWSSSGILCWSALVLTISMCPQEFLVIAIRFVVQFIDNDACWVYIWCLIHLFEPPVVAGRELGLTVLLSFRLSGRFLGIASLVFSKFWHGARNPYEVVCDIAGFSRKKKFSPKIERMDQKWAKNMVFEFIENFWH